MKFAAVRKIQKGQLMTDITPTEPTEAAEGERLIRELAFQLWQSEGSPEGRDQEFWDRAKERLEAETKSSYPPTQSRAHRT